MDENPSLTAPVFEHHHNGIGIQSPTPRISWRYIQNPSTTPGWQQTAYELELTFPPDNKTNTHHITSPDSILVPWPTTPLTSRSTCTVRVRAFGGALGQEPTPTAWSPPSRVEAALLSATDWHASFITAAQPCQTHDDEPTRPLWFRRRFRVQHDATPVRARLYVTALGVFEAYLNGRRVNDEWLAPGWTSYEHRLAYSVVDVTGLLRAGGEENMICVEVAEGWYAGRMGFRGGKRFNYGGKEIGVMAQLEVFGGDGLLCEVVTDSEWQVCPSARREAEIYNGELYDMREAATVENIVLDGGTAVQDWFPARVFAPAYGKLFSSAAPPVRVTETISPVDIFKSPSGKTIIDFGQNLVGVVQLTNLQFPAGHTITLRHAEVLEHGELGTRPLRTAKCTDTIIFSDKPLHRWTPAFTFHGFRYIEVTGWDADPSKIKALVLHSALERRGHFSSSNASLNRLHSNIVWSMRGNFLSIPADCPNRDERLGWTGDIQIFAPTACFLYNTTSFLTSWVADLQSEQLTPSANGIPPLVCPDVMPPMWTSLPQAIWDDATILVPWTLYTWTLDPEILTAQLPSMRAWLDRGVDRDPATGLWNTERWQFGDWLDPAAPPDDMAAARTDPVLVADAYLVRVTEVMARVCGVLGEGELAERYASEGRRLKGLFRHKYVTPAGMVASSTQTGYALVTEFGLLPEGREQRDMAAKVVSKLVRSAKFRISTGFAGTPVIAPALTRLGLSQLAYRMVLEKGCPSWMFPVTMGATTVWERWDSMRPDGSINPGQMTSFNHYALGSVAEWLHGTVGGICPSAEHGWKKFVVKPVPGGNLTSAKVAFDGPYGLVECSWQLTRQDGSEQEVDFEMTLLVPVTTTAMVTLPDGLARQAGEAQEVKEHGSGLHHFRCAWAPEAWPPAASYAPFQTPEAMIAE